MTDGLKVPSLVEALATAVGERVLSGQLPGGTPLTEKEVSTFYDVARPTAKAALERLVYEGLLRRGPNKTARVPLLSPEDIRDLYYNRGVLEREVVAALARSGNVPVAASDALAGLDAVVEHGAELAEVVQSDIAFHRALVDALNSPRLTRMYRLLVGETRLCMTQDQARRLHPAVIGFEHKGILQAIGDADPVTATSLVTAHLERACTRLTAGIAIESDLGSAQWPSGPRSQP